MSTPTAPASEPAPRAEHFRRYDRTVWRIVEAQHRISTNRLADDPRGQAVLEALVEEVKPPLPEAARGLPYLLATPFRYGHRNVSRFRRAGARPGIFYGSEKALTAVWEAAYWRLRFFANARGMQLPSTVSEHSAFTVRIALDRAIDLSEPPFSAAEPLWTADDYSACHRLADAARALSAQAIRYVSARTADRNFNLALLDPAALVPKSFRHRQTWHFKFDGTRLTALAAFPEAAVSFTFAQFGLTAP